MPSPHRRIRPSACALGGVLAVLMCATAAGTASADTIRQAEWPLDSGHLQAAQAWQITRGQGVTVAVVDSGVDARHPDLAGQVLPGASFLGDTHDDGTTDISGDSHGTAIAGIIAGSGKADAGTGMTGLAPAAKILPVRVAVDSSVQAATLAEGIKYAADHHAQVINVSLTTPVPDPLLRQAVTYALGKGCVVVAAAGNDGQSGNAPMYPGAIPGVVDVTGTSETGAFWPVSESGPYTTLAAPATDIYSTNAHGKYVHADGTSYAAAYVSAAVALVRSAHPELTAGQTIRRLVDTARHEPGRKGRTDNFGYGSLDVLAALRAPTSADGGPENPLLAVRQSAAAGHGGHTVRTVLVAVAGAVLVAAAVVTAVVVRRKRRRPSPGGGTGGSAPSGRDPHRTKAPAPASPKGGRRPNGSATKQPAKTRSAPNKARR